MIFHIYTFGKTFVDFLDCFCFSVACVAFTSTMDGTWKVKKRL